MTEEIVNIVRKFSSISLKEMDGVALMKRTDTKFILNEKQLFAALDIVHEHYRVLEIGENRIMTYASLYFETEAKKFYHDHHNGKINRTKIRMRKYVESDLCFLEIKQKDGKGNTTKSRISIDDFETDLSDTSADFVQKVTETDYDLIPIIWNRFNRITLVSKKDTERVTVDLNLSYKMTGTSKRFPGLVIVELKQERFNRDSHIVRALKSQGIHPYSLSKYCIGMVSIYKDLKYNIFKKKLLQINKITA